MSSGSLSTGLSIKSFDTLMFGVPLLDLPWFWDFRFFNKKTTILMNNSTYSDVLVQEGTHATVLVEMGA
jgi:hypothetical protein